MSTLKALYDQLDSKEAEKMMDDTHKDVLLHPSRAIVNLGNRITDELSCEDELMAVFHDDGENMTTAPIYDTAIENPEAFVKKMQDSESTSSFMDDNSGVRSWVTLAFMLKCREDIHAHNGVSKQFYQSWLMSELLHLQDAEAKAAAAPAEAAATE